MYTHSKSPRKATGSRKFLDIQKGGEKKGILSSWLTQWLCYTKDKALRTIRQVPVVPFTASGGQAGNCGTEGMVRS